MSQQDPERPRHAALCEKMDLKIMESLLERVQICKKNFGTWRIFLKNIGQFKGPMNNHHKTKEQPRIIQGPIGIDYIPTEEERRVFRECNQESFWYRSLPISATSMAFTQFLISRGALTSSGRFGSLPKLAFAGVCGYLGGKMSYMNACQEKFKSLENSPLGEALRQKQHHQPQKFTREQTGLSDPNKADFEPAFQLDDQRDQSVSYASDFTSSNSMHSADNYGTQITAESSYIEEDVQKKGILYKDLQSKNRENYEVTMTPKPDALLKSSADSTPAKRGKKNIYGDTWEE